MLEDRDDGVRVVRVPEALDPGERADGGAKAISADLSCTVRAKCRDQRNPMIQAMTIERKTGLYAR